MLLAEGGKKNQTIFSSVAEKSTFIHLQVLSFDQKQKDYMNFGRQIVKLKLDSLLLANTNVYASFSSDSFKSPTVTKIHGVAMLILELYVLNMSKIWSG